MPVVKTPKFEIEPMTAASDPFSGQDPMEVVPRGGTFRAAFTISVDRTS